MTLAVAPLLVALVTAVATLVTGRSKRLTASVSLLGAAAYAVAVGVLYRKVAADGAILYGLSGWEMPFGIGIVADPLSTFMLALTAVVSLGGVAFSIVHVEERGQRLSYHSLYHFMIVGVTGAFLTGDLFNLFVWFEVMLLASYVLVVFYGGPQETRAGLTYVVLNLIGSAVMLLGIGGLYATTGTLNMADLAQRLAAPGEYGVALEPVLGLSGLLFVTFALKAGLVPFQFWVPGAYRAAPAPVAAVMAGVVKKVGVYAVIRLYFTVFAAAPVAVSLPGLDGDSILTLYGPVLFLMATASIVLGGLAAVSRDDLDGVLAYSSIAQVGFIVLPLAVGAAVPSVRPLAITAALVYTVNHGVAKALLFLASGSVWTTVGSTQFSELGGVIERRPVLSGAFLVGALALVGIPPLIGFFGKFYVFDVAVRTGANVVLGVALLGAILTIAYVSRTWNRAFWGQPGETVSGVDVPRAEVAVVVGFAVLVVVLGIGFEPVVRAAESAADAAIDRDAYVQTVLGGDS